MQSDVVTNSGLQAAKVARPASAAKAVKPTNLGPRKPKVATAARKPAPGSVDTTTVPTAPRTTFNVSRHGNFGVALNRFSNVSRPSAAYTCGDVLYLAPMFFAH